MGARRARAKFLRFFPKGFNDETYIAWERGYKQTAHDRWSEKLGKEEFQKLIKNRKFTEIARRAVGIESRTNLLFSFEKMALRDAVRSRAGAKRFAQGLYEFLHGDAPPQERFERWIDVIGKLPRKKTRVLTWPLVTVFGFIAQPQRHLFLKPNVTRVAARRYGFDFDYRSKPNWNTYRCMHEFGRRIRDDLGRSMQPRDHIDTQSYMWVAGSDEYAE